MRSGLKVVGVSARGLVRHHNEDAASVNGVRLKEGEMFSCSFSHDRHALLVADGMGGHARGDIASDLVLRTLEERLDDLHSVAAFETAIQRANRAVYDLALSNSQLLGMGSTLVGAAIDGSLCRWFNVGDSRAYMFTGELKQLSEDHTPLPTNSSRRSHAVTRSLGGLPVFRSVSASSGLVELGSSGQLLLCSDGLTDVVSDAEIAREFEMPGPAEELVERLLSRCLERGAPDNVTVVLATAI